MKKVKFTASLILLMAFAGITTVNGQWATNGSNINNTNAGNVGIGNSTPATLLHVGKNMTEPTIRVHNLGGTGGATFQMVDDVSGADWKFKATNAGGFKIRDNAYGLDVIQVAPNSSANALYIDGSGNVGLSTTPSARLDVKSTSNYVAQFNGVAPMYMGIFENDIYRGYWGSYSGAAEDVDFGTGSGNTTGKLNLAIQAVPKLTINSSGNVGIGTTNPNYKLHINGGDLFIQSSSGLFIFGYEGANEWQLATTGAGADLRWYTTTDGGTTIIPRHYFSQNGNVGLGGFSGPEVPIARLEVKSSGSTGSTNAFVLRNSTGDTLLRMRDDGRIGIGYNGDTYGRTVNLAGTGVNYYTSDNHFGGAIFPTDTSLVMWSNSNANNYLVLQPSWGNTGIGTYSPDAKLDVNGTVILGASGTMLTAVIKRTVTLNIPSIPANSSSIQTFSVTNAPTGSSVAISPATALSDGLVIAYARVSTLGSVEVKFYNSTGSAIDPPAMDFYITVVN
jgi:hypothetical protein